MPEENTSSQSAAEQPAPDIKELESQWEKAHEEYEAAFQEETKWHEIRKSRLAILNELQTQLTNLRLGIKKGKTVEAKNESQKDGK